MARSGDSSLDRDELAAMPKIDAHAHLVGKAGGDDRPLLGLLERQSMRWIDLCWFDHDSMLREQIDLVRGLSARHPDRFSWATAFSLEGFGGPRWTDTAIAAVEAAHAAGAVGVKVWKNIGMVLRDGARFVMIDDERFDPVLARVRELDLTLAAHIGEPRNCWLPLEEMTVEGDRSYFGAHPQYHGLKVPEIPGYGEQVAARDRMLARHPGLRVVGCHLASLEFDVAEIAKRLDTFPNLAVDLAARVCHLQVQEREKVRRFVLSYQDRILYGTDLSAHFGKGKLDDQVAEAERIYLADAGYFATDELAAAPVVGPDFRCRGIGLPAPVLRKLFHDNALRWYPGIG